MTQKILKIAPYYLRLSAARKKDGVWSITPHPEFSLGGFQLVVVQLDYISINRKTEHKIKT